MPEQSEENNHTRQNKCFSRLSHDLFSTGGSKNGLFDPLVEKSIFDPTVEKKIVCNMEKTFIFPSCTIYIKYSIKYNK